MTHGSVESLRIGCVRYLNAQPLVHGWPGTIIFDHPTTLCRQLASAELEVALVSSFEFLRRPIYHIVDDVAVASVGPVYSVFVALAGSIEEAEEIELDPASLTSVNLLRCLLGERGLHPRIVPGNDEQHSIMRTRARLLIGDQAIRFRQQHGAAYEYWDLAEQWFATTGLPFVFALWLIRPEVEHTTAIANRLRAQRDQNLASLDSVIAAQGGFRPEFCAHYFQKCLQFRLATMEKKGLLMFRSLCAKHGILSPDQTSLRLV